MGFRTKRAYEAPARADGRRYLVDGLWPRGRSAADLKLAAWRKELAPTPRLRQWYGHDPSRFGEFRERYRLELLRRPEILESLRREARRSTVTLVFASRDPDRSNAAVLVELLREPREPAPRRSRTR